LLLCFQYFSIFPLILLLFLHNPGLDHPTHIVCFLVKVEFMVDQATVILNNFSEAFKSLNSAVLLFYGWNLELQMNGCPWAIIVFDALANLYLLWCNFENLFPLFWGELYDLTSITLDCFDNYLQRAWE
jgi:hypothetical protein